MRIGAVGLVFGFFVSGVCFGAESVLDLSGEAAVRSAQLEWEKLGASHVRIRALTTSTQALHRMPLTVVIDRDSPWTLEQIVPYIRKAEAIFKQCDLKLSPITLVELSDPNLEDFSPTTDTQVTKDYPESEGNRPVVTFTDGLSGYVYANTELKNTGWNKDPELAHFSRHTVFVDYLGLAYYSVSAKSITAYQGVVAHELIHTLLDVNHNNIVGNIMNENVALRDFNISAEQCSGILRNSLVKDD